MTHLVDDVLEKLDLAYSEADTSNSYKTFILSLVGYILLFYNERILQPIKDSLEKQKNKRDRGVILSEQKCAKKIQKILKDIKDIIVQDKTISPETTGYLRNLYESNNNKTTYPREDFERKVIILENVIKTLLETHKPRYLQLCRQFGDISDDYVFKRLKFHPCYKQVQLLRKKYDRDKQVSMWFYWYELSKVLYIYANYKNMPIKIDLNSSVTDYSSEREELMNILSGKVNSSRYFDMTSLKRYLSAHYFYTRDILIKIMDKRGDYRKGKKKILSFDKPTGELQLDGKSIIFKNDKRPVLILDKILRPENRKRKISWEELFEDIDGQGEINKSYWRRIYDSKKTLNNRILKELGIKNFLVGKCKEVAINSKYLRKFKIVVTD